MSPLAEAVYALLRGRPGLADPRITYKELSIRLRESSPEWGHITQRSRQLYLALGEVADWCRREHLPSLAALVVRADSRRPGEAYFACLDGRSRFRGERVEAWRRELEAVGQATYPARGVGEDGKP